MASKPATHLVGQADRENARQKQILIYQQQILHKKPGPQPELDAARVLVQARMEARELLRVHYGRGKGGHR